MTDVTHLEPWFSAVEAILSGKSLEDWRSYDRVFGRLRASPLKLLLFGGTAPTAQSWAEFLPNSIIYRLAVGPRADHERILEFDGEPRQPTEVSRVLLAALGGPFDVIIDDDNHFLDDTWLRFDSTFRGHLRPGGFYLIDAWAVGFAPWFPEGAKPNLLVRKHAQRLGAKVASHDYGLVGLAKALMDHIAGFEAVAAGVPADTILPIRSMSVMPNFVSVERW